MRKFNSTTMKASGFISLFDDYYFLSPHIDDAVLSCGLLLAELQKLNKQVNIITLFSKAAEKPYSPQALSFLKSCGYSDAKVLFNERKIEDAKAMKFFGCKYLYLDFIDAAWRKIQTNNNHAISRLMKFINNRIHMYPSEAKQFSGKISKMDEPLLGKIRNKIWKIIPNNIRVLLLAPLGIGNHVDHIIANKIVRSLGNRNIIFWEDYPYNSDLVSINKYFSMKSNFELIFELDGDYQIKDTAIRNYKSQMPSLFPRDVITHSPEKYYIIK